MIASKPVKLEVELFKLTGVAMTIIQTYHTMRDKIQHIVPTGHIYRERNLAWFMTGVFHSRSVHTSRVANKIPGLAHRESRSRRLSRFLDNGAVRVREWYQPTANRLLAEAAQTGVIRLIIDGTKVAHNHQLLMVSLAGVTVVVTGDSEFTPLQALLDRWEWFYALRQKGSHLFRQNSDDAWRRVDSLVNKPGERVWLADVQLTQQHRHPCHFLAYWRRGEAVPWLLATNLPSDRLTIQHYNKRAWVEEMFGDFKGNGFDLEASCLHHFLRLSRLTLVVALLYVWLFAFGTAVIKRGDRHLVDRADRRDLSVFRIGFDMLERCLINYLPISIRDVPYFT
jgi:hypothetical protein